MASTAPATVAPSCPTRCAGSGATTSRKPAIATCCIGVTSVGRRLSELMECRPQSRRRGPGNRVWSGAEAADANGAKESQGAARAEGFGRAVTEQASHERRLPEFHRGGCPKPDDYEAC